MARFATGTTFGNYTLQGLIAGGGMGEVYAARDDVYGSTVALKVLHPALHNDPSWRKRFNEEGLVGTQLKHPHILSARELVESDGRIALVMDLISGGQTLDKVVGREFPDGLPLVPAMQVFLGIVQGIEYLHGKEIVHGDLKPENVMIEGEYRDATSWAPKVTDFGTVALIADPVTIGGRPAVVATPRYASPEHLYGVDKIEKRSDIYALGLMLHFLLTGRHTSSARNVEEAARTVMLPVPIVALVDQPDALIAMFQRACAIEPEDRFQSCRELAMAVRQVLDSVGAVLELADLQADLATEVDERRAAMKQSADVKGDTIPKPVSNTDRPTDPDEPRHIPIVEDPSSTGIEDRVSSGDEPSLGEDLVTEEPVPEPVVEHRAPLPGPLPVTPEEDEEMERTTPSAEPPPPAAPSPEPPERAAPLVPADAPDDGKVPVYVWVAGGVAVLLLLVVVVMNIPG